MKNIISNKKITVLVTIFLLIITISVYVLFLTKCFGNSCGSDNIRGFIKPTFWFAVLASVISLFFLFFPQVIFTSFLKHVASWYLPILLLLTANTSIYSSHIMSVDRSVVVLYGMVLLGLIAVAYAFVMRKKVPV